MLHLNELIVSSSGSVTYSELVAFLAKLPNVISQYKSISILGNETLILTGNHLVYAKKGSADQFNPM